MINKNNFPTFPNIPGIKDELGKNWKQPTEKEISEVTFTKNNNNYVVNVKRSVLNKCSFYFPHNPTALYEGKVWRTKVKDVGSVLCVVIKDSLNKSKCYIHKFAVNIV
tara:strand:- start:280 stop:603 length:324 start_codon:yes stop_codon:yes gene_type:complete